MVMTLPVAYDMVPVYDGVDDTHPFIDKYHRIGVFTLSRHSSIRSLRIRFIRDPSTEEFDRGQYVAGVLLAVHNLI